MSSRKKQPSNPSVAFGNGGPGPYFIGITRKGRRSRKLAEELLFEATRFQRHAGWEMSRAEAMRSAVFRRMVFEERSRRKLRSMEQLLLSFLTTLVTLLLEGTLIPEAPFLRVAIYLLVLVGVWCFLYLKYLISSRNWDMDLLQNLFDKGGVLTCDDGWPSYLDMSSTSIQAQDSKQDSAQSWWFHRETSTESSIV